MLLWLILHIFLGFILICQNIFFCCFRFKQMYLCFLIVKEIGFRQSFLYVFSVFVPVAWPTYSNICYSAYNIVNLVTLHRFCFFGGELKHQTHVWVKFMHCHSCLLTCDYMHSHKQWEVTIFKQGNIKAIETKVNTQRKSKTHPPHWPQQQIFPEALAADRGNVNSHELLNHVKTPC